MELEDALARRRMVRSFESRPLAPGALERLLRAALRSPSAGNTKGTAWVVLEGPGTRAYWDATTTPRWRAASRRWPGLSRAPVVAVSLASPDAYVARYGEPDKSGSGLDATAGGEGAWPVPYWWADAAFGVMAVLLGAVAEGLGACFLGNFRGERALLDALEVPAGWRVFGAVVLGYADGADHASASLRRAGPHAAARVHHGRWSAPGVG